MTASAPFRFLTGLTRLLAVFFGIRGLENLGALLSAVTISSAYPENEVGTHVWLILHTSWLMFYLALMIVVWIAAPSLARISLGNYREDSEPAGLPLEWSQVIVFLGGIALAAWGLVRLPGVLIPLFQTPSPIRPDLTVPQQLDIVIVVILMGFGAILMFRFADIHRWLQRRSERPGR